MVGLPILSDEDVEYLVTVPKVVGDRTWRDRLVPPVDAKLYYRGRLDLPDLPSTGPVRGSMQLYSRANLNPALAHDFSVGFIYTNYSDQSYRVIRCNGPHDTDHTNVIEGNVIVRSAHIHRLTERYQALRPPRQDGFAEATDAYLDIVGALEYLAALVNLQVSGALFR